MTFILTKKRRSKLLKSRPGAALGRINRSGLAARGWIFTGAFLLIVALIGLWQWRPNHEVPQNEQHDSTGEPVATQAASPTGESSEEASNLSEKMPEMPAQSRRGWQDIDNPADDGWSTEVNNEQVSAALKKLGKLLSHGNPIEAEQVQFLASADFHSGLLVPAQLETVFEDKTLLVQRALDADSNLEKPAEIEEKGASRLATLLRPIAALFADSKEVRFKFKVFFIRQVDDEIETRQFFAMSGLTPTGRIELNTTWNIRWTESLQQAGSKGESPTPKIKWIGVENFEQVRLKQNRESWFSDCTESVLAQNVSYQEQLQQGMNHWLEQIQATRYFSSLGTPGLAVGDVNGDGLDDLYLCQEAQLPNRLFLQQPDGTALDASKEWGVDWLENSRSALLVDLDNDGDQDLVVAILGGLVVARNENNSRFEIQVVLPTDDDTMSLTAVDYENDGDLDLYICVDYSNDFFAEDRSLAVVGGASNRVYHDSNNAGGNVLFRNDIAPDGSWNFTDVTEEVGLNENNHRFSLAASWDDFDNDGDQDLYVANDFGRNNLYRNDTAGPHQGEPGPGKFVDIARDGQTEDSASGMSAAWGDYDRDGMMDIYVGNMFSAAGGRITNQTLFKQNASDEVKTRLRRFARGSTLLRNQGDGAFNDHSEAAAVTVGRWAWGSNFVDINNDGWQDIVVANGYITADDTGDL